MANSSCTNVEAIRKHDHAELIADGIVHALGVGLGLIGSITIILTASSIHGIDAWSVVIYAIGLLTMLGFSAVYNLCPISHAKSILRRFDHSAIYLMIAGTYTPFIAQMKIGLISAGLAVGVWSIAIVGIALKLVLPGRLDRLSIVLYLALGWSGAAFFKQVASALPSVSLWLLAVGGVAYSTGVLFHLWRNLRFQNAIWHGFVLAGACCHYLAVLACVRA
jgi:hemolysin III